MTGSRIVLITRRFWPYVGGAEMVMANLAAAFRELGVRPHILTAQWQPDWPREVVHREVPVTRLPNPARRGWGTFRYMTAVSRWLRRHRGQYDGVLVSMLKHSAYAALGARQPRAPVVLRAEGGGVTGDCHWHRAARLGGRIRQRCLQADAVVAPSEMITEELSESGFAAGQIRYIPNGVPLPPPCRPEDRRAARLALAQANPDLAAPDHAPVAVYTGRLDRRKGLFDLPAVWRQISQRHPQARLWLVGEGPDRDALYQLIKDCDLRGAISLPGAFDHVDELLRAADLFLLPSYEEGMSISLLEAMGAALPVVASDIPGNRQLVQHQCSGLLAPARDAAAWADAIERLLCDASLAAQLGAEARRRVERQFTLRRCAEAHLQLLDQLRAAAPPLADDHASSANPADA